MSALRRAGFARDSDAPLARAPGRLRFESGFPELDQGRVEFDGPPSLSSPVIPLCSMA